MTEGRVSAGLDGQRHDLIEFDLGGERYLKSGEVLPDSTLEDLRGCDAIYLGAVGHPGVPPGVLEKGILLRAYWIGLIGIAVTLLWVVISYYIIKSSSHHFKDHAEHVRRGLP